MRVERLASCENFVPRFQTSSILPFRTHPPDWYLNSHEETQASAEELYRNFYHNEGLEYKLTRAPLLGLAKSTY